MLSGIDVPKVMDNWVKKVHSSAVFRLSFHTLKHLQIGFPVVTVTETEGRIHVRQDRFLDAGPAEPKDNETIWFVHVILMLSCLLIYSLRTIPLYLLTVSDDGKATINTEIVLDEREKTISVDTNKLFKLNAGTVGVCQHHLPSVLLACHTHPSSDRVLYSSERLAKIAEEAAKTDSVLSLEDRMGLIMDAPSLAKAGFTKTSSTLTLIDKFRNETECEMGPVVRLIAPYWFLSRCCLDIHQRHSGRTVVCLGRERQNSRIAE